MPPKLSAKEQAQKILETHGGKTATQAANLLLQDPNLKDLKPMLEFISKNWRDPLRPGMINLACKSISGKPQETEQVAVAMSLMNLSFYLWDDIIDKTQTRLFKPTLFGKFGEAPTLIIGGLASAKAYTILNQTKLEQTKRETITEIFWNMWAKMAQAETANLQAQGKNYSSKDKFLKMQTEANNLEQCLRIGAILGNGSEQEVEHLGKYGQNIGIVLELQHDVQVSLNLTLELADKIRTGAYPYALLWAKEHNPELQKTLTYASNAKTLGPKEIEKTIKNLLETKALDEIEKTIKNLIKQALNELEETKKNRAVRALRTFAEVQPQLFHEKLSEQQMRVT